MICDMDFIPVLYVGSTPEVNWDMDNLAHIVLCYISPKSCNLHKAIIKGSVSVILQITRLSWFGFIKLTAEAVKWSLGCHRLSRGPPKHPLAASAVSFMNTNQDNLIICRKLYLNYPGLKDAEPLIIALCNLQLFGLVYATKHYMSQIAHVPVNFKITTWTIWLI